MVLLGGQWCRKTLLEMYTGIYSIDYVKLIYDIVYTVYYRTRPTVMVILSCFLSFLFLIIQVFRFVTCYIDILFHFTLHHVLVYFPISK